MGDGSSLRCRVSRAGEQRCLAEKACDESHAQYGYACLARVMKNEVLESPESLDSYEADNECQ